MAGPSEKNKEKQDSPFRVASPRCPICQKVSEQYYVKPELYEVKDTDLDMRPSRIEWKRPGLEKYHPSFYYMWHCPHCYFTAHRENFEDPTGDTAVLLPVFLKQIRDAFSVKPAKRDAVKKLASGVALGNLDVYQAVRLHLLGIFYLENVREIRERDAVNLARYYLRLSWLYEDMKTFETNRAFADAKTRAIFALVKDVWPEVPDTGENALKKAYAYYELTMDESSIPEKQRNSHVIWQIMGRTQLKWGNILPAKTFLQKAFLAATREQTDVIARLKPCRENINALPSEERNQLIKANRHLKAFLEKTETLVRSLPKPDAKAAAVTKKKG